MNQRLSDINDITRYFGEQLINFDQKYYKVKLSDLSFLLAHHFSHKWHAEGWRYGEECPDWDWDELIEFVKDYEV